VNGQGPYDSSVTWSASEGTIAGGLFVPSAKVGSYTITAASTQDPSKSGSATVNVVNAYTVTVSAGSGGSISGANPQVIPKGASTTPVSAVPTLGYSFTGWTGFGFLSTSDNPLTITNVQSNLAVTANFVEGSSCESLTTVTNPPGATVQIGTLPNCSGGYLSGTPISMTAPSMTGYSFESWSGSDGSFSNSSAASITFTIAGSAQVTANYHSSGLAAGLLTPRPLGTTAAKNGYWEYLPSGYGDGTLRPVLVFLPGSGENGSGDPADLVELAENSGGPLTLIYNNQWVGLNGTSSFVVLSPQHDPSKGGSLAESGLCPGADEIRNFMAFAQSQYQVDPSRIYLTGLSCGAIGSEEYFAEYGGENVAASVLIAGYATTMWDYTQIESLFPSYEFAPFYVWQCQLVTGSRGVALWDFHGSADANVDPAWDNMTMPLFMACPQPRLDVEYTVYPGAPHEVWGQTYDLSSDNQIYTWLLQFHH
jgi:uncharacterized repeat protein (TIGR02543 family)